MLQTVVETLRGGLFWRLKHYGWSAIMMLTVIISHIVSNDAVGGESEICLHSTAYAVIRVPSVPNEWPVDQQFRRLSWFLLVTGQVVLRAWVKTLTRLGDGGNIFSPIHSHVRWIWSHHKFHVFVSFMELILPLTSTFKPWWSNKIHGVIPFFYCICWGLLCYQVCDQFLRQFHEVLRIQETGEGRGGV